MGKLTLRQKATEALLLKMGFMFNVYGREEGCVLETALCVLQVAIVMLSFCSARFLSYDFRAFLRSPG